ncbi:CAP domain-containing protein [bacterium]|nr:CAP domain-containing protein [bacterium]
MRFLSLFLLTCLLISSAEKSVADEFLSREALFAHQYINQIRTRAGLPIFGWNPVLQQSAHNHAVYISGNQVITHFEKQGNRFFTGVQSGDRAIAQGYYTHSVTENFSSGQRDSLESIDGLMSAIYHRFGFLDFSMNEIGIALVPSREGYTFVYNMGNEQLNQTCKTTTFSGNEPYYQDICRDSRKISVATIEQVKSKTLQNAPSIVIWPPDRMSGVSPVFYEEIPDPLPNQSVSGYPVSIQFNPAYYQDVKVTAFTLYEFNGRSQAEVSPVYLLHSRNDPNRKFEENQYALFPLHRLQWGKHYQAEVQFDHQRHKKKITWRFFTKEMLHPLFEISAQSELLAVKPGKTYAVHIRPEFGLPYIRDLQWEAPVSVQVDVKWEDKNTILLNLSGESCQAVRFIVERNRYFQVQIDQQDNLNPEHQYSQKKSALSCLRDQNGEKEGFLIDGKGEILNLLSGREYWVEVNSPNDETAGIRLHYPEKMQVEIKHLTRNVIKIKLSGAPGQRADFLLQNNRSFQVMLVE